MSPNDPPEQPQPASTPVALTYAGASQVTTTDAGAEMALAGNTQRALVALEATVKDPLHLREALSVLYAVVKSDYRYQPKDRTAYAAYLRMKRETSHLGVWQAQQAYFSWLHRNDPLAAMILDPNVSQGTDILQISSDTRSAPTPDAADH